MKRICISLVACLATVASFAQESVSEKTVSVSESDLDHYISSFRQQGKEKELSLTEVQQAAELLFVTRALAEESKSFPEINAERAEWLGKFQVNTALKEAVLNVEAQRILSNVDFEVTAKDLYEKQKSQFKTEVEVRAAHILISLTKHKDDEARAAIEEIHKLALAGGDFLTLAKERSEDPSAKRNSGDLGFFGVGKMVPVFEETAFALELGEISDPIRSPFGYHIIKLLDKKGGDPRPFEEVKDMIVSELKKQLVSKYKLDRVNSLAASSSGIPEEEVLKSLVEKYNKAQGKKN